MKKSLAFLKSAWDYHMTMGDYVIVFACVCFWSWIL